MTIARAIGPRQVGGTYYSDYWQQAYTVESIEYNVPIWTWQMTCRWADGHRTTHSTPWDYRRDRVIAQPSN